MKERYSTSVQPPIVDKSEKPDKEILTLIPVSPATDAEILAYLRRSAKFAEVAALAERDALILAMCEQLGIAVSDAEWQADGDAFRLKYQLWGTAETLAWLKQQRIKIQDWSQGIRVVLLEKKLKEHLFSATVKSGYISNQNNYRRVALSQIVLFDLKTADKIIHKLQAGSSSFCILAWEYSQEKQSQENGGFIGIRCLVELAPEIAVAIIDAQENEVIGPIPTKMGYHIIKVEKWFASELNQVIQEQIMDRMFIDWLKTI